MISVETIRGNTVSENIVLRFKNFIVFSKKKLPEKIEILISFVDPVLRKETSRLGNLELTPMTIDLYRSI